MKKPPFPNRDTAVLGVDHTHAYPGAPAHQGSARPRQLCKKVGIIDAMEDIRPTMAVLRILKAFLDDPQYTQYGYKLMQETGFSSAKTYQILARLTKADWLQRKVDPGANPDSGGPPRVTYVLRGSAVPVARRLLAEASTELSPAPARVRPAPAWARRITQVLGVAP
jgi:hypothetical protein